MRHRIGPTILYAIVFSCIHSRYNGISYLETAYIFIPNKQHIYISVRNFCTQKQFPIACYVSILCTAQFTDFLGQPVRDLTYSKQGSRPPHIALLLRPCAT